MADYRQIDAPAPTIVGPRPVESAGGKINVPQGIEQLLLLSGLSADWKQKVLADPLAAAQEAGIGLTASERGILKSLPRPSLARMAASFQTKNTLRPVARLAGAAAALAAAALLAGTRTYAEEQSAGIAGARAVNSANDEAPPIAWLKTLPDALAAAAKTGRVVMAVINDQPVDQPREVAGLMAKSTEDLSPQVCNALRTSRDLRAAAKVLASLSVWVPPQSPHDFKILVTKYDIEGKLPAVIFLAPDGTLLTKVELPTDEAQLIGAMKTVPPLLAKWLAAQRQQVVPPTVSDGIRPQDTQEQNQ